MSEKDINRWQDTITPRDKAPQPWTLGSGGSWDMQEVQPIPDAMLDELMQRYHYAGVPWNCRSMPLSPNDREYMFLLYYSMQGLVARMRIAEQRVAELEGDTGKSAEADEQAAFKSVFKDYYAKHGFISSEKEALEFFRAGSSWAGRAAPEGIPYRATLEFDDGKRVITGVMPDVDGDTPQASPHAGPHAEDRKP